ncbi:MAG: hypothetical protein FJX77_03690 [Armatimonadetes bacterium]|nr:hypothetical protein [Armatimonadota bacterium]
MPVPFREPRPGALRPGLPDPERRRFLGALTRSATTALPALAGLECRMSEADPPRLQVDTAFPGGNGLLRDGQGDILRLAPDLRDTTRDWFYWSIRVRGAAGRTLTVQFDQDVLGPLGPALSLDDGRRWRWLGRDSARQTEFRLAVPRSARTVRLAFCLPYTDEHLRAFLRRHEGNPHLTSHRLTRSRGGRSVPRLAAGRVDGSAEHRVLLVARHHACETMANYALEGLLEAVLGDNPVGAWFRERVEFWIVPFMDRDGVEAGDQGKLRGPHAHWEDYALPGIYPEVRALREQAGRWAGGRLRVALDVHCPSRLDQKLYFAGPSRPRPAAGLDRLARALEAAPDRAFPFSPADGLPFNTGWNTATYYQQRRCFMHWAEELSGVEAVGTLEIPYARIGDREVTADGVRKLGGNLAVALWELLRG